MTMIKRKDNILYFYIKILRINTAAFHEYYTGLKLNQKSIIQNISQVITDDIFRFYKVDFLDFFYLFPLKFQGGPTIAKLNNNPILVYEKSSKIRQFPLFFP